MRRVWTGVVIFGIALLLLIGLRRSAVTEGGRVRGASIVDALASDRGTDGFLRALTVCEFVFPHDAGPHPRFQTEWWYDTGNLDTSSGRHFGYQLTIFRRALTARPVHRHVDWATSQVYFAHFCVTDVSHGRFHAAERWSRGALGLAGARAVKASPGATAGERATSFDAWVESWSMHREPGGSHLVARHGKVSIDLHLSPETPPVLEGDHGLSRKSDTPGNASYYYSLPRLRTTGTVCLGDGPMAVTGLSWLDREWSTSALGPDETGWDWFALQLPDGRDLMVYRLRRRDGSIDPASCGSLVAPNGNKRNLGVGDFSVVATDHWTSPRSQAVYPSRWRVRVPAAGIDLEVVPWLRDQELPLSFVYWEGAVRVLSGGRAYGNGYVELTGYTK